MGIKTPFICEIAKDTYAINEFGLATMYLLVGAEKALLIDTGCGVCDLRTVVANLTDRPYDVALSHGHMDHAGGLGHFSDVFLGRADFELASHLDFDFLVKYLEMLGRMGGYAVYDYAKAEVKPIAQLPAFHPISEGDVFNLGQRSVEAFEVPGHTPGGICFMDDQTGILFSGDACNTNLLAANVSVATTLRGLDKLKKLQNRFNRNFNGHTGYAGSPDCRSVPARALDDCIFILESVLNHTDKPDIKVLLGRKNVGMNHGCVRVTYNPERLLDEAEEPVRPV